MPELIRQRVLGLPRRFRTETANGLVAEWELQVDELVFSVSIRGHGCTVREGRSLRPDTVLWTEGPTWLAMDEGTMTGPEAWQARRLRVSGNLDLAVRLQTLFRPYGRGRRAAELDEVEVIADGVRLSCLVLGKGPPALLLHGLGATKISWVPVLSDLARRYRLVVPDLPGHGESDKPRTDYTPRYFARVVRHLMDELDMDRALVLGNSMGGRVGLELALRAPGRVAGLGLLAAALPGLRIRYLVGFTRVFPTEFGAIPFPLREQWMERVVRGLFARPEILDDESYRLAAKDFIRIYREPSARMAFFSSLRHLVTERPEPFWATMRRVKQPSLVVVGMQDRLVPPRLGIRLGEHLPNARLVVLPDVGHVPQFEAPERTLAEVEGFFGPPPEARPLAPA